MKKRFLISMLSLVSIAMFSVGLSACSTENPHTHTWGDWISDGANAHISICSVCGESKSENHTFDSGTVTTPATHTTDGVMTYACTVCGYEKTETILANAQAHTYSTEWSKNATEHWHAATCGHTDEVSDKAEHTWNDGVITTPATHTTDGVMTYACTVCGYEKTEVILANTQAHTYSTEWSKNATEHWHAATCEHTDEVSDKAAHTFDSGTVTTPATHTTDGVMTYACTACGYEKTEAIPADTQAHTYSDEWSSDETNHWHAATCGHDATSDKAAHTVTNGVCTVCGWTESLLTFNTLAADENDNVYGKVSNATETFSFLKEVTANSGTTYTVCLDLACQNVILSKTVSLSVGDNTFYILAERGNELTLFTVTLRRRPIYTVTFQTSGSAVASQQIEEDDAVAFPEDTVKTGYTFAEWTYDGNTVAFPYTVTGNITFIAAFTANTYTVTLDVNGGDSLEQTEYTATYDENFTFVTTPTRTGYTFTGWYDGETKMSDGAWKFAQDKTFAAGWQINSYKVTLSQNNTSAGTVSGGGTYEYGDEVTVKANDYGKMGYNFLGWYDDDGNLLSGELVYTFTVPAEDIVYTATWGVWEELSNFTFTSTAGTLTITGIKDNTVTEIIVPDYVTRIESSAFSGCGSLESITLPFVGGSASATSASASTLFGYIFGTNSYTGGTKISQCYSSSSYTTYYRPSTLKSVTVTGGNILYGAFYNCSMLTDITLGNSVTSIGSYAFYYCTSLTSITIPDGVTSIGSYAFYNCKSLTSITIPDGVTSIGSYAFDYCNSLTSITIPDSVTSIGSYAFDHCTSLTGVYITEIASWCNISFGNEDANPLYYYAHNLYLNNKLVTELTIPDGVTSIGSYTFDGCTSLTSITIPDGVTSIGSYAFYNCKSLTSITIPDSVTRIGSYTFDGCASLTSITIPNGVTSIGSYALYGCYKLIEVYNLSSLTITAGSKDNGYVAYYAKNVYTAVEGTKKLTTTEEGYIFYDDTESGNGYYLMGYTGMETELTLPDKYNGENYSIYQYAFYYCTSLTSVMIGNGVTSIGDYAFYYCTSLTSVTIGNGVTSIGGWAFYGCTSLTSVTFKNISGWWFSLSSAGTSGTSISSSDLANTSTAATYLTSTYTRYWWKRG